MFARNILAVAAAGGVALGALTGMAWRPAMKMAPLRPWQGGEASAYRDADARAVQTADAGATSYYVPTLAPFYPDRHRAAEAQYLPADYLREPRLRPAREEARRPIDDEATIEAGEPVRVGPVRIEPRPLAQDETEDEGWDEE